MIDISTVNGIINQLITRGHHLVAPASASLKCPKSNCPNWTRSRRRRRGIVALAFRRGGTCVLSVSGWGDFTEKKVFSGLCSNIFF